MRRRVKSPREALPADVALAAPDAVTDADWAPPHPGHRPSEKSPADVGRETRDAYLIASNIKRLLDLQGLTLERFAARLRLEPATLGPAIAGISPIPIDLLWRIARALAVPFGMLVQAAPQMSVDTVRRRTTRS